MWRCAANTQAGLPTKKRLQANENVYYDQSHNHTGTINLDATYTYDNEGKMTSVNYPTTYSVDQDENLIPAAGPTYTYSFDNMSRPVILTDQNNIQAVNGVTYGPSNRLLTINYFGVSETRTYNSMLQMTRLSIPGQVDISYTFPSATTNNGKITSQTDNISGEMVTYQYDSLNRLSAANGSGWNQSFGYDGFGNLVSKTGTNSPALSVAVDPATNRVVGQSYDANGNQQTSPTMSGYLGYDAENRLLTAPGVQYAYGFRNKRIWKGTFDGNGYLTGQWLYFYGIDGQKLGTYYLRDDYGLNRQTVLWDENPALAVFFGAKRVAVGGVAFVQDRLGSKGKYYPYGEERNSPTLPNDQVKFATYARDSATGLDYADQRYYANNFGRFMSPDPYEASGGPNNPGSWNRYTYVQGDPINHTDRRGLFLDAEDCIDDPEACEAEDWRRRRLVWRWWRRRWIRLSRSRHDARPKSDTPVRSLKSRRSRCEPADPKHHRCSKKGRAPSVSNSIIYRYVIRMLEPRWRSAQLTKRHLHVACYLPNTRPEWESNARKLALGGSDIRRTFKSDRKSGTGAG